MARKSKSGRKSSNTETRSNASGRSRRSSRSRTSRASASGRGGGSSTQPMEMSSAGGEAILPSQKWQSSACCALGCCKSLYGCCLPCAAATARHRLDGSSWCINFLCLNICVARNFVRTGYGIKGDCCADIMCSFCCAPCVACQILAETEKRGPVNSEWDQTTDRPRFEQPWKFGLLNCCDESSTCGYGWFCPACAVGTIRTQMDDSDWLFNCCCVNPFIARSLVRASYNIEGTDGTDFWLTCCCYPCSIIQMLNETQHRGKTTHAPTVNIIGR